MPTLLKDEIKLHTRTGSLELSLSPCKQCDTYACVKSCSLHGSGILRLQNSLSALKYSVVEASSHCVECLACELACHLEGLDAIVISLPIEVEK